MGDLHDVDERCVDVHCAFHHVDERGPAHIVCPECWHRYATARDLRRMYRRCMAGVMPWWRLVLVRASRLYFCPLCAHDF